MEILDIARIINSYGGRLYLVGGALRNRLLGINVHDEDYCVVGLTELEFERLFPMAHTRGKSFKVYDIEGKEIALARTEKKTGIGHKEFEIITDKQITIEQDLSRRDITINSMAQDVLSKEIIDPYGGRNDLQNKIIKATTDKFNEDPLRVYRVARFAAQLKFNVEGKTLRLMNQLKDELSTLPKERVFIEFKKALSSDKPSIFFDILKKADVLDVHFREIYNLIDALQPKEYHPEGDAYNHTMIVVDNISENTKKLEIRFSGLVHDLGKGLTPKEEYPHHYKHDINGVKLVKDLGDRIGVPKAWVKCGKIAASEHMKGGIFFKMRPSKQVAFIEKVEKSLLGLDGLQLVVNADKGTRTEVKNFASIGKQCLKEIDGKYIKDKYGNIDGLHIKEKLYKERVNWMKQIPYFPN